MKRIRLLACLLSLGMMAGCATCGSQSTLSDHDRPAEQRCDWCLDLLADLVIGNLFNFALSR